MTNTSTTVPSCLGRLFRASRFKGFAPTTSPVFSTATRRIAQISSAGLVLASAGFGAVYAWTTGAEHGLALGCLMVLMAVALELAKPLSIAAALHSFRTWRLLQGTALFALAAIAVAYSLTAELSLMASARSDKIAERAALSDAISKAHHRYDRATSEISGLATARTTLEIEALISGLLLTPGADGCAAINGKVTREVCPKVVELRAEKARADRRAELEQILAKPLPASTASNSGQRSVSKSDPAASALSTYLAVFGIVVAPAVLSEWIVLVGVLALEIGSAFASLLVQSMRHPLEVTATQLEQKRKDEPASVAAPREVVQAVPSNEDLAIDDTPVVREEVKRRIVDQLKASGGAKASSERGLAKLLGTSKPTVRRAINGLAITGVIAAEATRNGTMLRLLT